MQADNEQDRDDDPELDTEINFNATAATVNTTAASNMRADEESKTVGNQGFGVQGSSAAAETFDDSPRQKTKKKSTAEDLDNDTQIGSNRNMDEEERIWQKMIDAHGRTEYITVHQIIKKYVSESCFGVQELLGSA